MDPRRSIPSHHVPSRNAIASPGRVFRRHLGRPAGDVIFPQRVGLRTSDRREHDD